jgi:hypothetical protein
MKAILVRIGDSNEFGGGSLKHLLEASENRKANRPEGTSRPAPCGTGSSLGSYSTSLKNFDYVTWRWFCKLTEDHS